MTQLKASPLILALHCYLFIKLSFTITRKISTYVVATLNFAKCHQGFKGKIHQNSAHVDSHVQIQFVTSFCLATKPFKRVFFACFELILLSFRCVCVSWALLVTMNSNCHIDNWQNWFHENHIRVNGKTWKWVSFSIIVNITLNLFSSYAFGTTLRIQNEYEGSGKKAIQNSRTITNKTD